MLSGPFGAVPADRLPGASLLSQCVETLARGLVLQEAVTSFTADAVNSAVGGGEGCRDAGLFLQAEFKKK